MFKNFIKTLKVAVLSKSGLITSILFGILTSLVSFIPLFFGELILNKIYETSSLEFWDVFIIALVQVLSLFIIGLLRSRIDKYNQYIHQNLWVKNNIVIAKKSLDLDYDLLESDKAKESLSRAQQGRNAFGGFAAFFVDISQVISSFISLIIGSFYISRLFEVSQTISNDGLFNFLNSYWCGIVIILVILLAVLINLFIFKKIKKVEEDTFNNVLSFNRSFSYYFEVMSDYRLGKDVRIYGLKDTILNNMKNENDKINSFYVKSNRKTSLYYALTGLTVALIYLFSYLFVSLKAYYGLIAVGSIISVVGSITNIANALLSLINSLNGMRIKSTYLSYYFDYLDIKNKKVNVKNYSKDITGNYVIEFKNVSFKYPNTEDYIFKGFNLKFGEKNKTALVGKNGSGKTTLIKLLSRLYKPESGEILINGKDIWSFEYGDYQKLLSIVFQDFSLFPFTIKENVACDKEINEHEIEKDLDDVHFDYKKFDKGINTYVYKYLEEGVELSGGESQKVAIARALYKKSNLVLLDEPTSALDPISEAEIYKLFDKLVSDKQAIYISHRMSSTRFCDDIIVLDNGQVIERGSHESLMKSENGLYKQMFEAQAKYYK